ncbi:MAG: hypothetical protein H7A19_18695 [Rhodanobacteraceae bacterium]|nr:hypothetical protein [Rhodanobacteraceae bacterium]
MYCNEMDWISAAPDRDWFDLGDEEAFRKHVVAIERSIDRLRGSTHGWFLNSPEGRQCLVQFFNRAGYDADALAVLDEVLNVVCSTSVTPGFDTATIVASIMSVLTHPYCAEIPIERFVEIAEDISPMFLEHPEAKAAARVAQMLFVAHEISRRYSADAFGGGASCRAKPVDEEDAMTPGAR